MTSASIYLEVEKETLPKKDLLMGGIILKAFDDFELQHIGNGDQFVRIAGFEIEDIGTLPVNVKHPYGSRPSDLVEEAIRRAFPEHQHLLTNASVDSGGYVSVRGMHANDIFDHPYFVACMGIGDDDVSIRLQVRKEAFDIVGLPQPTDVTVKYMKISMNHGNQGLRNAVEHQIEWLNSMRKSAGSPLIEDKIGLAKICFCSDGDGEGRVERSIWPQTRLKFVTKYPGSEILFTPFPQEQTVLADMRDIAQGTRNMDELDAAMSKAIGRERWESFRIDPHNFCAALQDVRLLGGDLDNEGTPSP